MFLKNGVFNNIKLNEFDPKVDISDKSDFKVDRKEPSKNSVDNFTIILNDNDNQLKYEPTKNYFLPAGSFKVDKPTRFYLNKRNKISESLV